MSLNWDTIHRHSASPVLISDMARRPEGPTRRVSVERMLESLERTLRAEGKSEKTVLLRTERPSAADYLKDHGRPLTVDVSRDDIREVHRRAGDPAGRSPTSKARVHMGGSPATACGPSLRMRTRLHRS